VRRTTIRRLPGSIGGLVAGSPLDEVGSFRSEAVVLVDVATTVSHVVAAKDRQQPVLALPDRDVVLDQVVRNVHADTLEITANLDPGTTTIDGVVVDQVVV
jgi:hypothetical protein